MSLMDRIKKTSTIKEAAILERSAFFNEKDNISTSVPILNIALGGSLNGGITPGVTMWAGASKHFKTGFSLMMAKAYLDHFDDAVLLFYDSEFGSPQSYFETFGIDTSRVFHVPITDVEELKFDLVKQMKEFTREDHVIIVIDSIGNLASKKEVEDALDAKSVADMSRAKALKSLFRIVTPHLTLKNIPLVAINHVYKEIGMYPRDIVGGGTGGMYSSNQVFIVGRQQEKEGTDIAGYNFIINVEKSRFVKEKSKIPVSISYETGINKFSGLMEIALEGGFVVKPKNGWYAKVDLDTGEVIEKNYRLKDTNNAEFWNPLLNSEKFQKYIESVYKVDHNSIVGEQTDVEIVD